MTKTNALIALLLILLLTGNASAAISSSASSGRAVELLASVREAFQEVNPLVARITIMEIRLLVDHRNDASDLRYVLLAHAIREDQVFPGHFDDEMFGVFEVDEGLTDVVRTIGSFSSPRWNDYSVWIESVDGDDIVLGGQGSTYRDDPRQWTFDLAAQ